MTRDNPGRDPLLDTVRALAGYPPGAAGGLRRVLIVKSYLI